MKQLIVNADDFGLTLGVNRAIIEAHTRGIVTSATLLANMPAFDDAVRLAKAHPTLGVGLHFNISQGRPVAKTAEVRSLLAPNGEFLKPYRLALNSAADEVNMFEIMREFRAQAEKLLAAGLTITHVDSHKHAHALPPVFYAMRDTMGLFGINAMRLPRERVRWLRALRSPKRFKQGVRAAGLTFFCGPYPKLLDEFEALTTDHFFGAAQTGFWSKRWLLTLLKKLPEGTSELMCHPGYDDAVLGASRTRLRASREAELRLLTDPEVVACARAQGIELINFGQLGEPEELEEGLEEPF
jgi:hopanoid biosynthesis associated protein HpnK